MGIKNIIRILTINIFNRLRLKNKNISLIASNCNGACILHDLGLEFNSPFVNLYLMPKDFVKLCYNLKEYMNSELVFIENSGKQYPVAMLKDITIYFMHYKSEIEVLSKWQERVKRIDYNHLYFLFTDRDGCSENELLKFDKLPYKYKAVFVNKKYPGLTSAVYIPGFEKQQCVGVCTEYIHKWSIYKHYDAFDYVKWFNQKEN